MPSGEEAATVTEVLRLSAFSDGGRGGNPAGVVLEAADIHPRSMQEIAAAVGYSETAFLQERSGVLCVRYFSPRREVAFCGHATIALAVALAERRGVGTVRLRTRAGEVAVETERTAAGIRATLVSVTPRSRPATPAELAAALAILGWSADELDPRLPSHVAFAGNDHLVVAAHSRARLDELAYDEAALAALMTEKGWTTLHLVWAEREDLFWARDPFPVGGVREDPATGSAAAAFGGYLRQIGALPACGAFTILQGAQIGRPSRLEVEVGAGATGVRVSGFAVPVAGR